MGYSPEVGGMLKPSPSPAVCAQKPWLVSSTLSGIYSMGGSISFKNTVVSSSMLDVSQLSGTMSVMCESPG